jgi:hypothetical protein
MTENILNEKKAALPSAIAEDFTKQVEQSMERKIGEHIKVVRVFDNCYRCNWWMPDKSPQSFWLASGTIRKSRFVRATKTTDGVRIEDVTRTASE